MKPNKAISVLIFIGIIGIGLYLFYLVLPTLLVMASNILYLGVLVIVFIVIIVAIFKAGKRLFK